MRIMHANLADLGTLTAASANASFPVTNLQQEFLATVYKTGTSSTAEWVSVDLGSARDVSAIVLAAHNFTAADNLRYQLSNDSGFSGAHTYPIEWSEGNIVTLCPTQAVRYVKVLFTKQSSGQTRQLGRLFVGDHYATSQEPNYSGVKYTPIELSLKSRSIGGQTWGEIRNRYREVMVPFDNVDGDQSQTVEDIALSLGSVTAFFVRVQDPLQDLNTDVLDEVLYVKFKNLPNREVQGVDVSLLWKQSLELEEQV